MILKSYRDFLRNDVPVQVVVNVGVDEVSSHLIHLFLLVDEELYKKQKNQVETYAQYLLFDIINKCDSNQTNYY